MVITILLGIGFLAGSIPLFWIYSKFKKEEFNPPKWLLKYSTLISLTLLPLAFLIMAFEPDEKNSASTESIKQEQADKKQAEKELEEQRDNDPNVKDSKAQIKQFNKDIADSLQEDQNLFAGTSKHTGTSESDPRFSWADKVKSIEYQRSKTIDVQVAAEFLDLNESDKKAIIDSAKGCAFAGMGLSQEIKPEDTREGLSARVHFGKIAVGHSKFGNNSEYKWYKSANQ